MPESTVVADILLSSSESGDTRVNIGEKSDGEGFGAVTPVWGVDGFVSVPNPPSSAGAAQGLVHHDGYTKRVIASRDNRFADAAGSLAPGDRAIVSDSTAWIKLTKATNKIEIVSGSMNVVIDGSVGTVTIKNGATAQIVLKLTSTPRVVVGPTGPPEVAVLLAGMVPSTVLFATA